MASHQSPVEPASTILIDLEGVSLRTSLRLMLGQVGLAYAVKDGLVIVSSPGRLRQLRVTPGEASGSAKGSPDRAAR